MATISLIRAPVRFGLRAAKGYPRRSVVVGGVRQARSVSSGDQGVTRVLRNPETPIVFVLGGPGSGKGTQSARVAERFGFLHLSAGELLRAHVRGGTEEGKKVRAIIDGGNIVPSEITVRLLDQAVQEAAGGAGIPGLVIDGFPRTIANRVAFLDHAGRDCDAAVFLECDSQTMESRLLLRHDGRADDASEVVARRLVVHATEEPPVRAAYDAAGLSEGVDGARAPDEVWGGVEEALRRRLGGRLG